LRAPDVWLVVVAAAVIVEGIVLVGIMRLVGLLYRRLPPVGAPVADLGPDIGTEARPFEGSDLDGVPTEVVQRAAAQSLLLVYMSPRCDACSEVAPALSTIRKYENARVVIAATKGAKSEWSAFVDKEGLNAFPIVTAESLPEAWRISASPFAILIAARGVIAAKGYVNRLEHLESLFEYAEQDVAASSQMKA